MEDCGGLWRVVEGCWSVGLLEGCGGMLEGCGGGQPCANRPRSIANCWQSAAIGGQHLTAKACSLRGCGVLGFLMYSVCVGAVL